MSAERDEARHLGRTNWPAETPLRRFVRTETGSAAPCPGRSRCGAGMGERRPGFLRKGLANHGVVPQSAAPARPTTCATG